MRNARFVFIVLLSVMLYFLVRSMVIHYFFRGGQRDTRSEAGATG